MSNFERNRIAKDPARIIYLHIAKTAGMSINGLLDKTYRSAPHYTTHLGDVVTGKCWSGCFDTIRNMPEEKRNKFGLFKGHMYFGLHEILTGPCEYITFLRDPVSRSISHYQMLHRYKIIEEGHEMDSSKPDWNLGAYPAFHRTLDNYQTRILSGADPDMPFGACREEHLRMALANMDHHFTFVGLTEQFDLSLLLLRRICGWGWHFYVPVNVGANKSLQLKPNVVAAIRDLNRFDFAIYKYAEERLQKLSDAFGAKLRAEHQFFRTGNAVHKRFSDWRRGLKKRLGLKKSSTENGADKRKVSPSPEF